MLNLRLGLRGKGVSDEPEADAQRQDSADDDDGQKAQDELRSEGGPVKMQHGLGCEYSRWIILDSECPFKTK